jgi:diketogulonate reductase-like aldo/keto reductase
MAHFPQGSHIGPGRPWLEIGARPWIAPIPGTTKAYRLEENLGSIDLALTANDLQTINTGSAKITVRGERLPDAILRMMGH